MAQETVDGLRAIPGDKERAAVSALTLNTFCSIARLAEGKADGRVETAVAALIANKPDDLKQRLTTFRSTLENIPSDARAELLGGLGSFDPGLCEAAPDWDRLRYGVIFNHQLIPHLRFNFCSNNFTYADGSSGERAITTGEILTGFSLDPDGVHPPTQVLASLATPALIGVERSEFVFARHPGLAATADAGEGMSPYGFVTNISCSAVNNSCDASQGLRCLGGSCVAYPVVQKDQTMVLRGYNFWDVAEARLVFEPIDLGQGSESTSIISTLDPNEPLDAMQACKLPSTQNATHNRAHFRVPANEGHFYRLRMFNHNGQFLTQQDGIEDGPSRVIHTCYPVGAPADNIPQGTIRDCTQPQETCVQDGATCTTTWTTPPRKLEDCRHLPGQPPPCAETPEWYEAQMLSPRSDGVAATSEPIVFVEKSAPIYELSATLHAMEVLEETGIDFLGSDEPLMAMIGTSFANQPPPIPSDINDLSQRFLGSDYDEGERKIEDFKLVTTDLPVDGEAAFLLVLAEDDGFAGAFLAGLVAIGLAAAIVIATGGASLVAALGGASGVVLLWGFLVNQFIAPDDTMGIETISATPSQVQERIGKTHADDFLTIQPPPVNPLPEIPGARREGVIRQYVIHPFVENTVSEDFLQPECNSGGCPSGEQCLVNRCVDAGFVDPLNGVGFRERRWYEGSGGRYSVDLQWEMRPK
ncbi:MAG: hypothetical protein KDC27_07015 [Acidobacteria bacterium]|nr:hypothetical protein [Acidobacteriota bacterium]